MSPERREIDPLPSSASITFALTAIFNCSLLHTAPADLLPAPLVARAQYFNCSQHSGEEYWRLCTSVRSPSGIFSFRLGAALCIREKSSVSCTWRIDGIRTYTGTANMETSPMLMSHRSVKSFLTPLVSLCPYRASMMIMMNLLRNVDFLKRCKGHLSFSYC